MSEEKKQETEDTGQDTKANKSSSSNNSKQNQEPVYSKDEIMAAAGSFGVNREVMAGALYRLKKEQLTKTEVKQALSDFKSKKKEAK